MFSNVEKTEEGFYRYNNMPKMNELKELYENEYFVKQEDKESEQNAHGNYKTNYSDDEKLYINNELDKINFVVNKNYEKTNKACLDIGSGEGFGLNFFYQKGYEVVGLDFNNYACKCHNSNVVEKVIVGDCYISIDKLINENKKFDLIICMNVLEHVLWPVELLEKASKLLSDEGIFVVKVPNDFSVLQRYLFDKEYINNTYWVAIPDHVNYFSLQSLKNVGEKVGLKTIEYYSDFPIDINLLNENTNYIKNKELGRSCAEARINLENLMCSISIEKTIELLRNFADLGMGRNIFVYYKKADIN